MSDFDVYEPEPIKENTKKSVLNESFIPNISHEIFTSDIKTTENYSNSDESYDEIFEALGDASASRKTYKRLDNLKTLYDEETGSKGTIGYNPQPNKELGLYYPEFKKISAHDRAVFAIENIDWAKWWSTKSDIEQEQILLAAGVDVRHKGLSWQNLGQENQALIKQEFSGYEVIANESYVYDNYIGDTVHKFDINGNSKCGRVKIDSRELGGIVDTNLARLNHELCKKCFDYIYEVIANEAWADNYIFPSQRVGNFECYARCKTCGADVDTCEGDRDMIEHYKKHYGGESIANEQSRGAPFRDPKFAAMADYDKASQSERINHLERLGVNPQEAERMSSLSFNQLPSYAQDAIVDNIKKRWDWFDYEGDGFPEYPSNWKARGYGESIASEVSIDDFRRIVNNRQYEELNFSNGKSIVDGFTANAIVQLYDAIKHNPTALAKFERMVQTTYGVQKMANLAFNAMESKLPAEEFIDYESHIFGENADEEIKEFEEVPESDDAKKVSLDQVNFDEKDEEGLEMLRNYDVYEPLLPTKQEQAQESFVTDLSEQDKMGRSEESELESKIINRKLNGYGEEAIARELYIWNDMGREQSIPLIRSIEVSSDDKASYTLFGKRLHLLNEAELDELKALSGY